MLTEKRVLNRQEVYDFANRIVKGFQPEKIVLFGSYAEGTQTPSSDVDLLVILRKMKPGAQTPIAILKKTRPDFMVDLIVKTPEQIQSRLEAGNFFLREILAKGQVLYESSHRRVGR